MNMRKTKGWMSGAMLTLMLLGLSGCMLDSKTSDLNLQPIKTSELQSYLDDKTGTVLVDVRIAKRYAEGHIPGAINIPLAEIVSGDARLGEAHNIITTSGGWNDYLAPAAAKKLMALGYKNVFDYRGGLEQWKADGGAVE